MRFIQTEKDIDEEKSTEAVISPVCPETSPEENGVCKEING